MTERPKRTGIMLCHPFERERLEGSSRKAWNLWPVITQPKLDGERCRVIFTDEGQPLLLSSTEEPIVSVPHIYEQLRATGLRSVEFDGELYRHGMSFEDIHSRVGRSVNLHPEFQQIELHLFDIVEAAEQVSRIVKLSTQYKENVFRPLRQVHVVESDLAHSFDQVLENFAEYCNAGYEGIIVRKIDAPYLRQRSTSIMKFKPKKSDIYRIVGSVEETDKHGVSKGSLGALVCCGDDGTLFNVGTGFDAEQRKGLWELRQYLPGNYAKVSYQAATGKGVPRFPVFVEIMRKEQ